MKNLSHKERIAYLNKHRELIHGVIREILSISPHFVIQTVGEVVFDLIQHGWDMDYQYPDLNVEQRPSVQVKSIEPAGEFIMHPVLGDWNGPSDAFLVFNVYLDTQKNLHLSFFFFLDGVRVDQNEFDGKDSWVELLRHFKFPVLDEDKLYTHEEVFSFLQFFVKQTRTMPRLIVTRY